MKKLLMLGTAVAVLGTGIQAQAQTMYTKDGDQILSDARYEQVERRAEIEQPVIERQVTTAERVSSVEPAAGDDPYADFTGFYAGVEGGYGLGSYELGGGDDVGLDGFNYGAFAGFGFEQTFTPLLGGYGGIEVGYNWSDIDGDSAGVGSEKESEILATFRPGVSLSQGALGYGIIGWSRAQFEAAGDDDNLDGLVLGAGTEINTMTPFRMRVEYSYTNYEDGDVAAADFEGHENAIKLGALMRF